jgi:hypothetical protein
MKLDRRAFMALVGAGVVVPVGWNVESDTPELDPIPAINAPFDCLLSIDGRDYSNLVQHMELRMEVDEVSFGGEQGSWFREPGLQQCFLDLSLYTDFASNRSAKLAIAYADKKQLLIGLKMEGVSDLFYQGRFFVKSYEHMSTNGWGGEAAASRATLMSCGVMDMRGLQDYGALRG